jgi:NitT/TauT family transport system substrate-binding protein
MKAPVHRTTFGSGGSRMFSALVLLALVLLILPACEPAVIAPANTPTAAPPVHLKVSATAALSFAPLLIAQQEGYFAEQGLDVEFVQFARTAEALPALLSGQVDVSGIVLDAAQLNAIARGGRVKIVADKGHLPANASCPYLAFMVRRDVLAERKLDSPEQLRGLKVSIDPLSFGGYALDRLLTSAGLTFADLQVLDVVESAQLAQAMENGAVDFAQAYEPTLTRAVQGGKIAIWRPVEGSVPDAHLSGILFGPNLLDKNPDAGRRFMVTYLKAVRQYNQGKTDRNVEVLAKATKLDSALLKQACWPAIHDDGQINVQSVIDYENWAVQKKLLDRVLQANEFWDPSFVEYANNALKATP